MKLIQQYNAHREALWSLTETLRQMPPQAIIDYDVPKETGVVGRLRTLYRRFVRKQIHWYIHPLTRQQTAFNTQVLACLEELHGQSMNSYEMLATLLAEYDSYTQEEKKQLKESLGATPGSQSRQPRVLQIVSRFSYGDGVCNDVLGIRRALQEAGIPNGIYATYRGPGVSGMDVYPTEFLPELSPQDMVIFHYGTEEAMTAKIKDLPCQVILRYHNITPPEFFAPYQPEAAACCKRAYDQLSSLIPYVDHVLADSPYNAQELQRMGFTCPMDVLPVVIPYEDYDVARADAGVIERYGPSRTLGAPGDGAGTAAAADASTAAAAAADARDTVADADDTGGTTDAADASTAAAAPPHNIIFVGRIVPNKRFEDLIDGFIAYRDTYDATARLFLVGTYHEADPYYQMLREKVADDSIIFTGHISFSEILAYYCIADVLVCLSQHEGFCVPLVEAMLLDTPVIALDACALPDTLGDAGMLLPDAAPDTVAHAIHRMLTCDQLRRQYREAGHRRLQALSYASGKKQLLDFLARF